ncbi:enoyl-CoA hydratase/isomerase family protein [Ammoniphilus sp. YIM 78166]|uniref:enoyl-CoA hydratase/isomerase family protein n=1 Tax=Ammoniphilus sp. YIM 78166 TaxID=1644106 RepID=UPI00106F74E2|nr:enoyl-CoA hydratase-related protein [Ammoniphilus sp. YIM 78166]
MRGLLEERLDQGRIVLLTLNRPEVMNSINTELGYELRDTLDRLNEDPTARVIVFTGSGERSFCTGGDLKERNGMTDEQWLKQHRLFQEVFRKIRQSSRPVITAVNGYALGGGCELAFSGDIIYASNSAKFGLPEVTRGIIPGVGGTQTIGRFLPRGVALEMLLTGKSMTAEEAYKYGMVNKLVEPGHLIEETINTARVIAQNSPLAVRMAKKAFRRGIDLPLEEGVEYALECYNRTVSHSDRLEGVRAYNEKRLPNFQDIS